MNAEKIITDYFNSNIKTEEEIKMGPEYEHIIVDRDTYKSVSYYGENGVESIFKKLVKLGWEPEYEGEHILQTASQKNFWTKATQSFTKLRLNL